MTSHLITNVYFSSRQKQIVMEYFRKFWRIPIGNQISFMIYLYTFEFMYIPPNVASCLIYSVSSTLTLPSASSISGTKSKDDEFTQYLCPVDKNLLIKGLLLGMRVSVFHTLSICTWFFIFSSLKYRVWWTGFFS